MLNLALLRFRKTVSASSPQQPGHLPLLTPRGGAASISSRS